MNTLVVTEPATVQLEVIEPQPVQLVTSLGVQGPVGPQGPQGDSWAETYETVSKNLNSNNAVFAYTGAQLNTITYDLGSGQQIVKTFVYTGTQLTSITLSGDTPGGISLTKTFSYTGAQLTSVAYSA